MTESKSSENDNAGEKVVLTYSIWQQLFGGDPAALGRELVISGRPHTVVGVMPRDFVFVNPAVRLWVPMAFTELYPALETKAVDGQENPHSIILSTKFFEVQKYLSLTNHTFSMNLVQVSRKFWDGLPSDIRSKLEAAMKEATTYEKAIAQRDNDMALEAIRKSGKTQIYNLSAQEQALWRNALLPVQKQMEELIGKDLIQAINRETAK